VFFLVKGEKRRMKGKKGYNVLKQGNLKKTEHQKNC